MIDFLRNLEYKLYGSEDFEYTFLEDDIKAMYTQDRQTATIYSIFCKYSYYYFQSWFVRDFSFLTFANDIGK